MIGKRPIIPVLFEVKSLGISKMVNFLVDTGSLFSSISEKDATLMGLDCTLLPEAKRESIGFGGSFRNRIINRLVILTFKSGEGEHKIRYSSGFRVTHIPRDLPRKEREKLLRYTPSVLGMDILTKFEIYMDKRKVELTLIG